MKAANQICRAATAALLLISPAAGATGSVGTFNPVPATAGTASRLAAGPDDVWQVQLEFARRLRREQDFTQADQCLTAILETPQISEEVTKTALLDLAASAQEQKRPERTQQILAQYIQRFPQDPVVPELQLRQGYLFRELGAYSMALSKFYAVMTTVLNLKLDDPGHQQQLVLQAQTEIAETHFQQGKYTEAVEYLNRLLKLEGLRPHRTNLLVKLIRCAAALDDHAAVSRQAEEFLAAQAGTTEEPEVRYLHARALFRAGDKPAALRAAWQLIEREPVGNGDWLAWRQRLGNEIGNALYSTGDFATALQLYVGLLNTSAAPAWRVPLFYQIGLCHERLAQPAGALKAYEAALGTEVVAKPDASLQTVLDLLRWRKNYVAWQIQAEQANLSMQAPAPAQHP